MENLVKRILEADGITEEMIEQQRAKAALLQRMLEAPSEEALESIIRENDEAIDAMFFRILTVNLEMAETSDDEASAGRILAVRDRLLEISSEGQVALARSEAIRALRNEPTRERLLQLLIDANDSQTRRVLVSFSQQLVDYRFFQLMTARIDQADDGEERERLIGLRKEILTIRDELAEQAKALLEARGELLRDLLMSEDPERLARRRFMDMDEAFLAVLRANMEQASASGNEQALAALQDIWEMTMRLVEETTPPELRFLNRLMSAEDEETIDEALEQNRPLVTEHLAEMLERAEASMREDGDTETADQLVQVLGKVRAKLLA
jgi:hypothetical protein